MGKNKTEIPFVRLETPASVMIGTLGTSPFIVIPEDCNTKYHIKIHTRFSPVTGLTFNAIVPQQQQFPFDIHQ